jgi:hypothetical protein
LAKKSPPVPERSSRTNEGHAASAADAGNGGGRKRDGRAIGNHGETFVQLTFNRRGLQVRGMALVPVLESDKEEGGVGILCAAEQIQAGNSGYVVHTRRMEDNFLHFLGRFLGPLQGSGLGKLQANEGRLLIFFRHKGSGQVAADEPCSCCHHG